MVSPISPLNLRGERVDILGSALAGRQAYEQSQRNQLAMRQGQQEIERADYDQAVQRLGVINRLATKARSITDPAQRSQFVGSINQDMLRSVGIDPAQISSVQLDDQSLDALIAQTSAALPKATGEAASFNEMTAGLKQEDREKARRIALGLDPRAVGSAAQTIAENGTASKVGASEAEISRQKELAEALVRLGFDPERARRVAEAEAAVKLETQPKIDAATTGATIDAKNTADAKNNLGKIENTVDRASLLVDELLNHEGRASATGVYSLAPTIPGSKQADFVNRFDQIKGQAFIQAFESLKGAGGITEKEGDKAAASVDRLSRSTSPKEFEAAAADLKSYLKEIKENARKKASPATPGINPNAKTVNWSDL